MDINPDRVIGRWTVQDDGCYRWGGTIRSDGYGIVSLSRPKATTVMAHRAAYVLLRGPIPAGYELDHLCGNPSCVNVEHLEAVTPQENNRRKYERKNSFPCGHPFTDDNILIERARAGDGWRTWRACRACKNARSREQKRRKRAADGGEANRAASRADYWKHRERRLAAHKEWVQRKRGT